MIRTLPLFRKITEHPYTRLFVWFPGGSSAESEDELGYAHFAEHLLFKLRFEGQGIADFIEARGGYSNAFTSHDFVALDISLLNEFVPEVAEFLNNLLKVPLATIDTHNFDEEKSVVLEEMSMYEDEPMEQLLQTIMSNLWAGHPYSREIIGTRETLKVATPQIIDSFVKEKLYSQPFITMSGGYDGAFDIEMATHSPESPIFRGKKSGSKTVHLRHNQQKDYFMAAWKMPESNAEIAAYGQLIHTISYGMDGSRLYNELVYDKPVFDNISISFDLGILGATFFHTAAFSPTKEQPRINKWAKVWDNMVFTREELNKARESILAGRDFASESVDYVAKTMGTSYAMYGDKDQFEREYFYHIFNISLADLNRFKQKHLSVKTAFLGLSLPQKSKFTLGEITHQTTAVLADKEVRTNRKSAGVSATLFHRPQSSFVTVELLKRGGVFGDIAGKEGATRLMITSLIASAKGLTRQESEAKLDKYGIDFSSVSGNNSVGVKMKMRDSVIDEGVELLIDTLNDEIKEEDFNQEKEFALRNYTLKMENPGFLFSQAVHKSLFSGTPYASIADGTLESLQSTTLDDVQSLWNRYKEEQKWGVGISGAGTNHIFSSLKDGLSHKIKSKKVPKYAFHRPSDSDEILVELPGKKQSYISYIFNGPDIHHHDFEMVRVLESYLMTQNSPLFRMLREENGLVYSLSAQGMGGLGVGYIMLSAITSPENSEKTKEALKRVVDHMQRENQEESELLQLRRSMEFTRAKVIAQNDFHAFNSSLENALNIKQGNYLRFNEILKQMDAETMKNLSREWFQDGIWVVSN
ncbi:insulinase family protein [bacterium]|nr:insulinase family protein [bacterium]